MKTTIPESVREVRVTVTCACCGNRLVDVDLPECKRGLPGHRHVRCDICSPKSFAACVHVTTSTDGQEPVEG